MALILVVDDEARYRQMLTLFLKGDGHQVLAAGNGQEALEVLGSHPKVELVLLDALMPVLDGWQTCRKIKELTTIPVIMLTALSDEDHEVKGLKTGADDYIAKPFPARVLLARIQAAVRKRQDNLRAHPLRWGAITIDQAARSVFVHESLVPTTPREFELLVHLLQTPGRVYSREQLLRSVWGLGFDGGPRTVDTHIKSLRRKLGPAGACLVTRRGVGYGLQDGTR